MSDRLRLHVKIGMDVHELYNRDKMRFAARVCKKLMVKANRRAWKQSLQQGFEGEVPKLKGHW